MSPHPWHWDRRPLLIAGCFACFGPPIGAGDAAKEPGWAAASLLFNRRPLATAHASGEAALPYEPGLLALREGALLEAAVRALPETPDVLLVNATGRDHPRRAGLALHLGTVLDIPTVGVTDRPLVGRGPPPEAIRSASSPLILGDEVVGRFVTSRAGVRPITVHAAWRTDVDTAVAVVMAGVRRARTPEPIRRARRAARIARAGEPPPSPGAAGRTQVAS